MTSAEYDDLKQRLDALLEFCKSQAETIQFLLESSKSTDLALGLLKSSIEIKAPDLYAALLEHMKELQVLAEGQGRADMADQIRSFIER